MLARVYLRASTSEQDANRAREAVKAFAAEKGLKIAHFYPENESGAKLERPKLFELLADAEPGDILLVEQVDRLSRLKDADWKRLKREIADRHLKVVALDLPTSHQFATAADEEFTGRCLEAINGLMMDLLAATARKDYLDRQRRAAEGRAKAKAAGKYKGRAADSRLHRSIEDRLRRGEQSWSEIAEAVGCGRATVARVAKHLREERAA
jgi:DNA invertase Pin-like site-specific DNA recombinase